MNFMHFLRHKHEPMDKYEDYLNYGKQPKDHFVNERNLFDDLNSKDRKLLKITRRYLARNK